MNSKTRKSLWLGLTVAALLCVTVGLVACSGGDGSPTPEPATAEVEVAEADTPTSVPPSPTPTEAKLVDPTAPISPVDAAAEELPTPEPLGTPPPLELPTPTAGTGVVYGQVIRQMDGHPIPDTDVRLGVIVWLTGQEGKEGVVVSDRIKAPQAVTDKWGRFVITDIGPEETYSIFVQRPIDEAPMAVNDEEGGRLLIEIVPGEVVDLEEIEVPLW